MTDCQEAEEYFTCYGDTEIHKLMLEDVPRTEAYRDMILKNKDFIKGKTVMDVGAGTGILSLFCFQAGAKKVYAVEASPIAKVLRDIIKLNKAEEVVEVVPCKVEEVELEESVDVIVSEWMGFYLLHESMLNSVIIARDKHLAEDGVMLPSHATIWSAACSYEDLFWKDVYGFDMSPVAQNVRSSRLGAKPVIEQVSQDTLLTDPEEVARFDLRWVTNEQLNEVSSRSFTSILKNSSLQGILLWFDCQFEPWSESDPWQVSVSLSTSPSAPPTHWKQTFVPLPKAWDVEVDEVLGWAIQMKQDESKPRFYNLTLEMLDPATEEHPTPCHCQMAKCALIQALMKKEDEMLASK